MQYYKGNALQQNAENEPEIIVMRQPAGVRIVKLLVYPFLLIFWIVQDFIYKSVEQDD